MVIAGEEKWPERIGHFKIRGILGRGGMGIVFDALMNDERPVALKLIRPQGDPDTARTVTARFLRESKILRKLDHPNIVKLIDAGNLDGLLYLAMERIDGVSLLAIRRKTSVGISALIALGSRLADALAHMHDLEILHRDIKPANVLIHQDGRPIITDFGISVSADATHITQMGDLLGSPGFMAPEVAHGKFPDVRSDQYSLGRLLFELGALGPPLRLPIGAPLMELLKASLQIDWARFPKSPDWIGLELVLKKMTADDPAARYENAHAVHRAFEALRNFSVHDSIQSEISQLELTPENPWSKANSEGVSPADELKTRDLLTESAMFEGPPDTEPHTPAALELGTEDVFPLLPEPPALRMPDAKTQKLGAPTHGRPLSEIIGDEKPRLSSVPPAPVLERVSPDPTVQKLREQIEQLRAEVSALRTKPKPKTSPQPLIIAMVLGLLLGALLVFVLVKT